MGPTSLGASMTKKIGRLATVAAAGIALMTIGAKAADLQTTSQIKVIKFTSLSHLPKAPASAKTQKDCAWLIVQPKTEGGKLVAARGWGVTGEAPLGDYTAISFAGSFTWGPSAVCEIRDGNVGIFRGKSLVALAYGARHATEVIGSITALEGGSVRVWSGEDVQYPEGDLRTARGGFTLGDVAEADQVCGGKASVPNVYGQSIDKARLAVLADGWRPSAPEPAQVPAPGEREQHLSKAGVTEVQFCAGTGLANCAFDYTTPAGKLSLETVGEEEFPQVTSYTVACNK